MKPTNNKSRFHYAAQIIEELETLPFSIGVADVKIKALKEMGSSLDYELKRYKYLNENGEKVKIGEIELINFRDENK